MRDEQLKSLRTRITGERPRPVMAEGLTPLEKETAAGSVTDLLRGDKLPGQDSNLEKQDQNLL